MSIFKEEPFLIAEIGVNYYDIAKKEKISNKLWLTDRDQLKISMQNTLFFNGYTILLNIMKFLKEKVKKLCRNKMKKSIV